MTHHLKGKRARLQGQEDERDPEHVPAKDKHTQEQDAMLLMLKRLSKAIRRAFKAGVSRDEIHALVGLVEYDLEARKGGRCTGELQGEDDPDGEKLKQLGEEIEEIYTKPYSMAGNSNSLPRLQRPLPRLPRLQWIHARRRWRA